MDRYLLTMFDSQPRRFRVIENTVRNKRTQANLFWGLNYQILNWLGSAPELTRSDFNRWLQNQQTNGFMRVEDNVAWLTRRGLQVKQQVLANYYQPRFDQWAWLVNPHRYAERFLLAVQAVSELSFHNRHYIPLNISVTEMTTVRNWLSRPHVIETVHQELHQLGQKLSQADERLAILFANQLIGHNDHGWTLDQAQAHFHLQFEEIQVMNRDVWLAIARLLADHQHNGLGALMADMIAHAPISDSAYRTLVDFQRGYSPDQIAHFRRLKLSTVREHLLEAAIIIPDSLDWSRLLSTEDERKIHSHYSGPVQQWQFERPDEDPLGAFFQFRLCQIKELHSLNG